ncbi:methionine--tRNA ligase [Psychroflexus aestuariivivens]|uniref:methionine--tRNA ligase n=1 Tax=Psychroflexus aestuariivivens TaxID=1795040 RepID=UPI000FD9AFC4|nr:methionine--tRNA ligase [Psychroflexus aestuariivivens]
MKNPKRYTITAALPYTNGPIHIGHLAGVYVPADIYTRYLKQKGEDVVFVCGSDEHGVPITIKAKKEGITPQDVVDKYNAMIKQSFAEFGIQFDNYSRTSAKVHHDTASDFFMNMHEKGKFIEETTEQLYDAKANQFLADRFVTGTCPKCGNEEAYGDQCEKCGSSLNATDLINPKSAITGDVPSLKSTKHWFLPLDQYDGFLKDWILKSHKKDWKPNVYGQCKSWIDEGLRARAVTRDLDWGIPVPVEGGEGKVLYVWFDAPIGYISSTKEWAEREGKNWEPYWKDEDTKLVHFIGKDNIVFHCIIFPCMLKAEGSYILPDNVPANEFLNLEGQKLSTSRNWAVWLHEYLEDFPGQEDVLRYVLTANAPETKDNDFTWKDFQTRNNSELVAIYGNFINRVVVLTNKYYEGKIPEAGEMTATDLNVLADIKTFPEQISESIEKYRFREAQSKMMNLARLGNKYLADEEPWKLQKTDPERTKTIMNVALQVATALAVISEPFLPFTAQKLKNMLNFEAFTHPLLWNDISKLEVLIPKNHQINTATFMFSKIEDDIIQQQIEKLEATKTENAAEVVEPQKEGIDFEDFTKLDIRVGTILEAEKKAKTKKLMVLKVDTGIDQRTIVSGIAEDFKPEDIIGKKVSVVVNLKPIKLKGTISEGMILMTKTKAGKLAFVNPDENNISNGMAIV